MQCAVTRLQDALCEGYTERCIWKWSNKCYLLNIPWVNIYWLIINNYYTTCFSKIIFQIQHTIKLLILQLLGYNNISRAHVKQTSYYLNMTREAFSSPSTRMNKRNSLKSLHQIDSINGNEGCFWTVELTCIYANFNKKQLVFMYNSRNSCNFIHELFISIQLYVSLNVWTMRWALQTKSIQKTRLNKNFKLHPTVLYLT